VHINIRDFGSQYAHLIGERLRDQEYDARVVPYSTPEGSNPGASILSGSHRSLLEPGSPVCDEELLRSDRCLLGICYGAQMMAKLLGGRVERTGKREYGPTEIEIVEDSPLFHGLPSTLDVWMSHGDCVTELPEGYEVTAVSKNGVIAAFQSKDKKKHGLQCHPEVVHTRNGLEILDNFAGRIAGCPRTWSPQREIEEARKYVRTLVGDKRVLCLFSGGVDSFVAAKVVQMEYPDSPAVYFKGLDRMDDEEWVRELAKECGIANLVVVDATHEFSEAVNSTTDPQEMRRKVGDVYLDAADAEMRKRGMNPERDMVAQGTIFPDLIESGINVLAILGEIPFGESPTDIIKYHHNVGCGRAMYKRGRGLLVEPNRLLYKNGTRRRSVALGLPEDIKKKISDRKPFPGPGNAIRVMRDLSVPDDWFDISSSMNRILEKYGIRAIVHPVLAVGVEGDERRYLNIGFGRGGDSAFERRSEAATDMVNHVPGIGRLAYVWAGESLSQQDAFRIKPLEFTPESMAFYRKYDHKMREMLTDMGIYPHIMQDVFVLIPGKEKPWLVLRCVEKTKSKGKDGVDRDDFMTAKIYPYTLEQMMTISRNLMEIGELEGVAEDVTSKPPGTIEWY